MMADNLNAESMYENLLKQLKTAQNISKFKLVGLASGGVWIAQRLAKDLGIQEVGVINTSFHRDDYAEKGLRSFNSAQNMGTHLPFDVSGAHIILVDDVLDTGRTVRAGLNELFDYGRPAKVDLAVLADRHRRELPIDATFKGGKVDVPLDQIMTLEQISDGHFLFTTESKPLSL
jgi:pyrimidine operon attenuation protein / uracil phosphoribosyltransferase